MILTIRQLKSVNPIKYVDLGKLYWDGSVWVGDGSYAADDLLTTQIRAVISSPTDVGWAEDVARHYRSSVVMLDLSTSAMKHQPGRHDQKKHDPHKGKSGPVGLQSDTERQARWKAMLDDPEMSEYHTNQAIRAEIEALEGGPEALRQLEKWYWNPGDPDQALVDPMVEAEYEYEVPDDERLDYPYEDWVYDRAEKMGWSYDDSDMIRITAAKIKEGSATPAEVEAMSAIYDYTQAHIKHRGISEFTVTRGLAMEPEDAAQLKKGRSVGTSITGHWSAREDVSERFAANYYDLTPVEDRPETKEVVIHKTFKPEEVFDYHLAGATKFDDFGLLQEYEVVPVDGTEHKITRVESKKSRYGGLETLHIWVK